MLGRVVGNARPGVSLIESLMQLRQLVRLHTDLVRNSLSGITDDHARARPLSASNSMAFIAGHLIDSRYYLAATLGHDGTSPVADALESAKSIDDAGALPPIDEILRFWLSTEAHVLSAFEDATNEFLQTPSNVAFPTDDRTTLGAVTFLVHHEAYHIGQLGLLRKGLGYGPMSYERR